MSDAIAVLLICLGVFIFLALFFSQRARHLERMKMIEKGLNPDTIREDGGRLLGKKIGIIAVGLGAGLCIIAILALINPKLINSNAMPLAIVILCCGTALIVANKDKRS